MTVRIINADVLDGLRSLDADSVQCCVTSPPYWGLRDYGVEVQIGLEPTPAEFVSRPVGVFREVRRVLRNDGTCWVNLGDSYARDVAKGGAGTTGLVADRLQRHAVLIELNPEYAAMAERRINGDRGGLLDMMEAAE